MTMSRPSGHHAGPFRVVVGGIVALMVMVGTAPAVSADTTSSTTTTTTPLPPAPPGFANTVVNTYQSELATAQALGQTGGLEPLSQYQQQISGLDPNGLATIYAATQKVPEWNQIPALMQTIAADVKTPASSSATPSAFTVAPDPAGQVRRAGTTAVLASARRPSPVTLVSTPPTPFTPQQCPVAPPEAAIFAAQIVIDVANSVYLFFLALAETHVLGENTDTTAPFVAGIASLILLAAQIVHDTLAYLLSLANDCAAANLAGEVATIDDTTVQSYNLLTSLTSLAVVLQTTENATQQDVLNVQTGLTSLQQTLQQALTSATQTLQQTTGSDTQSTSTELQVIQTALQQDIATVESLETTNSQQVTSGVSKIQSSLSSALTQILNETDINARGLTTLITQNDQQILNTLQSNFAAQQQQYYASLQILIEQGLAGWGPVVPEVQLMLPASMGGLLDATPVGVQEVVTTDIQGLQAQGVKVKGIAITDLNAANTALAAKQYTSAWSYYAQAYQASA